MPQRLCRWRCHRSCARRWIAPTRIVMLAQRVGAIKSGWFVSGGISDDETGWSEARLWIPIHGERGEATLYARAGRSYGPWVFSELALTLADRRVVNLLEPPTSLG